MRLRTNRTVNPRQRRGVLLLIVVACILIAGLAMVGIAQQSLRLATDSVEAERELQRRWGAVSVQRTLLRSAPEMFRRLEDQAKFDGESGPFPSSIRTEVLLGGMKFDALVADEQAKANLNLAYHIRGKNRAEQLARKMNRKAGLSLRLLPEVKSASLAMQRSTNEDNQNPAGPDDEEPAPPLPAFRHWGQVFDLSRNPYGVEAIVEATDQLTCWGRGEVNVSRASDEVVEETCEALLGPGVARKFVREHRENPRLSVSQIALRLEMSESDKFDLRQLVTVRSSTFSVWLTADALRRKQHWFAVSAPSDETGTYTERFQF